MQPDPERLLQEIDLLRQVPPPSREAFVAGRRRFLNEAADLRQRRARGRYALGFRRILRTIAAALLLLVGALAGTTAAAQGVRPGSPLYPLKLAWEDTRLALAAGPQERAELALALAGTRVAEMAALAQAGRPIPAATLERLRSHLEMALQDAALLPDAAMQRLLRTLQEQVAAQVQAMEQALGEGTGPNREAVRTAVSAMAQAQEWAALGMVDPESFRRAGSAGFGGTPRPALPTSTATPPPPSPTKRPASPTSTATPTGTAEHGYTPSPGTPTPSPPPPTATTWAGHTPHPSATPRPSGPGNTPGPPENTPGPPNNTSGPADNTPGPPVQPSETHGRSADPTKTPRH